MCARACARGSAVLPVVTEPVSPRGLVCGIIPPVLPGAALEGSQDHQGSLGYHFSGPSIRPSIHPFIHPAVPSSHLSYLPAYLGLDRPTLPPSPPPPPPPSLHPTLRRTKGGACSNSSTASHPANQVAAKPGLLQLPHSSTTEHWVTGAHSPFSLTINPALRLGRLQLACCFCACA